MIRSLAVIDARLCVSRVCLIALDFPQTKRQRAVTTAAVGIHVLMTGSLFGDDIPRRLLLRVSLPKSTSAPLRF